MGKRWLREFRARRAAFQQAEKDGLPQILRRYLPREFSVREAGYPSAIEMLLQWEIRHRGCILAAREIFLDRPLPRTPEERISKWYICTALVEHAVQAFEDLQEILGWYAENWHKDQEALEVAISSNRITLHPVPSRPDTDTDDDSPPYAGLP